MKDSDSFFLYIISLLAGANISLIAFLLLWFFTEKDMMEIVVADIMFTFPVRMYFLSRTKEIKENIKNGK